LYFRLNAAVTITLFLMIRLDGVAFYRFGPPGLLGTHAALNIGEFAITPGFVARGLSRLSRRED
jgi:hypothetical protein